MIIKSFELSKINYKNNNFFLFYGKNQGHKNQIIEENLKRVFQKVSILTMRVKFSIIKIIFLITLHQNHFLKIKN